MNTSSRYRILWPRNYEQSHKGVSHWIFSMNGQDFFVYYNDGRKNGRGFQLHHTEFPPQWKYVNDLIKELD